MWITADYEVTTLFSLKPAASTSSGGRTLLIPTPFAIKMALLDVVCRTEGQAAGSAAWPGVCASTIAIRPAMQVVVNNTFTKIMKPRRNPAAPGSAHAGPMQKSIGYREYAFIVGSIGIALQISPVLNPDQVKFWLANIQSLGKRGSFMQLKDVPVEQDALSAEFIVLDGTLAPVFSLNSLLQQVDDTTPSLSFDRANIYSKAAIRVGIDRILHPALLPYHVESSSRGYTWYTQNMENPE